MAQDRPPPPSFAAPSAVDIAGGMLGNSDSAKNRKRPASAVVGQAKKAEAKPRDVKKAKPASSGKPGGGSPPSKSTSPSGRKKGSPNSMSKAEMESSRYDSSLGLLTKKFVQLLQEAPGGILDLNIAATKLGVQKRRIYDITNVLEGIGLIEKKSKNNIHWKGSGLGSVSEMRKEMTALRAENTELLRQEASLDEYIVRMQDMLRDLGEHRDNAMYAYVTHEDIRSLPQFKGQTLIAIKAPSGTTLEVPDPDADLEPPHRRYQIFLKSSGGPIDVYLVSQHETTEESGAGAGAAGHEEDIPPERHGNHNHMMDASPSVPNGPLSLMGLAAPSPKLPLHAASASPRTALTPKPSFLSPGRSPLPSLTGAHHGTHMDAIVKLEPPQQEADYFFNLETGEGIADLFDDNNWGAT